LIVSGRFGAEGEERNARVDRPNAMAFAPNAVRCRPNVVVFRLRELVDRPQKWTPEGTACGMTHDNSNAAIAFREVVSVSTFEDSIRFVSTQRGSRRVRHLALAPHL
jgi:hypothetical protein